MSNLRKTGGRAELDAAWTQINAIITDATAIRTALLLGLDQSNAMVLGRDDLTATIADLTELRTKLAAAIVDLPAVRTPLAAAVVDLGVLRSSLLLALDDSNTRILGRDDTTATVADLGVLRTQIVNLLADVTAVRSAELLGFDRANNAPGSRVPLAALYADLTELRTKLAAGIVDLGVLRTKQIAVLDRFQNSIMSLPGISNGSTAGKLKTVGNVGFLAGGLASVKMATDDFWDLSAEVDTDGTHYRAYLLLVDAGGSASFVSGSDELTSNAAVAALPAPTADNAIFGFFIADPSCDFDAGGGLSGEGTIGDGWPAVLADPAALTASAPAALTSAATLTGIGDGSTAGFLRTNELQEFALAGRLYQKAATDDLWNLSAEVDTTAAQWVAFWLYLDSAGTASIVRGTESEDSEAAAIGLLPAEDPTKTPIGVYVAGNSCDFDGVAGLAAQGTIIQGRPAALADPAALTATTPAAITTSATIQGISDGGTDGYLASTADLEYQIQGIVYRKAPTDDLWDLHSESDTDGTHYRAYRLYLDSAGVATFGASTDELSAVAALAALPAEPLTKVTVGVYVAGLSCDFDGVAGLAAQGTLYDGRASDIADPAALTATTPAALTASAPAALTTSATVGLADGSTAGFVATQNDIEFQIAGKIYRKAETDDLWDLSAEVDTIAAKYRAYRLYLDASGVATFAASTADADSEALALAALPAETATKCPVGIFVAGPLTDFDDVGGLGAQGTYYDGRVAQASDPAAMTATSTTLISA